MTNATNVQKPEDLLALIGSAGRKGGKPVRRTLRRVATLVVLAVLLTTGIAAVRSRGNDTTPRYRTEPTTRGTLRVTVTRRVPRVIGSVV